MRFRRTALIALLLSVAMAGGGPSQVAGKSAEKKKVKIVAERFSFTPSTIRVAQGTLLELELSSDDTFHGFRLPKANINVTIPARRRDSIKVLFDARKPGKYPFECSRPCGAGHTLMRGVIIVE